MRTLMTRAALALFALALTTPAALASTEEAWAELHADIERACLAALPEGYEVDTITVDVYGSKSYGLALLIGREKGAKERSQVICAFDKRRRVAEAGSPLSLVPPAAGSLPVPPKSVVIGPASTPLKRPAGKAPAGR